VSVELVEYISACRCYIPRGFDASWEVIVGSHLDPREEGIENTEREMCLWAISKYFGD
jgi:hypothetical protein